MDSKTLVLLIGPPGSGKSTWRRNWKGAFISPDAIRREEFGVQYERRVEPAVWKIAYRKLEELLEAGEDVCFDATNLTIAVRKPLLQMADHNQYAKKAVLFELDLAALLKRNEARPVGKKLSPEVVTALFERLELPSKEEGFDEIEVISP